MLERITQTWHDFPLENLKRSNVQQTPRPTCSHPETARNRPRAKQAEPAHPHRQEDRHGALARIAGQAPDASEDR